MAGRKQHLCLRTTAQTHARTHAQTHARTNTRTQALKHTSMPIHTHSRTHTQARTRGSTRDSHLLVIAAVACPPRRDCLSCVARQRSARFHVSGIRVKRHQSNDRDVDNIRNNRRGKPAELPRTRTAKRTGFKKARIEDTAR
eukprot:6204978-Pleurochrysis_carterae.AAC.3